MSIFALLLVCAAAALGVSGVLIWRARRPLRLPPPDTSAPQAAPPGPDKSAAALREWISAAAAALRYLCTPHEWRYQAPWVLVLGHAAAGKTSLAASLSTGRRQGLLLRERGLAVEGTGWRFSNRGVVIDAEGRYSCAAPDSAEGRRWRNILRELDNRRPERPLDAVVLAVSAPTLLRGSPKEREAAANLCYRQLWTLQKRFEFALPVYVVVSQCDTIEGFAAYWRAAAQGRAREMVGWSNPALLDGAPAEWTEAAFERLGEGLRSLQVQAAAQPREIAEVDRFFLFPGRFGELRVPLQAFLDTVFQPSAYHASFFFRGVYFTGAVAADGELDGRPRKDVAFVDDLFDQRIFAELNLARPTRQGLWSRNRLVRNLQIAGAAAFAALFAALAAASLRLDADVEALVDSLHSLKEFREDEGRHDDCHDRQSVYELVSAIAAIKASTVYAAIPVSWFDSRLAADAGQTIADRSLEKVILPAVRCQLERRARVLSGEEPGAAPGVEDYIAQVSAFEENLGRFERLAASNPDDDADQLKDALTGALEYAYQAPAPPAIKAERGALGQGLVHVSYERRPQLPSGMAKHVAERIARGARDARVALLAELAWGEHGLQALHGDGARIAATLPRFNAWLESVRSEWLRADESGNPCTKMEARLRAALEPLPRARYGRFEGLLAEFDASRCYRPARRILAAMQAPGLGPVFRAKGEALELAIEEDLRGLPVLAAQSFLQRRSPTPFSCQTAANAWRAQPLADGQRFVRDYQSYARAQGVQAATAALGRPPFYDQVAHGALRAALEDSLNAAQSGAALDLPRAPFEALSAPDQELARASAELAMVLDPLLQLLRAMQQLGFAGASSSVGQCARDFAAGMLARAGALADQSRLYDPDSDAARSAAPEERLFALGGAALTRDYLAGQLRRSEVLAGYAAPFVAFLKNTDAANDGDPETARRAPFWDNTVAELNRYVQFREQNGQVGALEGFFVKQLSALTEDNCGKLLGDYQAPAHGADLYSERRRMVEEHARELCANREQALALRQYRAVATRFNSELRGRFPFGDADEGTEASPAVVRAFFADYDLKREALRKALPAIEDPLGAQIAAFVDRLDGAAAFFRGSLVAGDPGQPLKVDVTFRALPKQSPGSEQLIEWTLRAGERAARYPAGPASLDYVLGAPVALELVWASQSSLRPAPDAAQPALRVRDAAATFSAEGPWALLRLIDAHRPRSVPGVDPLEPNRVRLEFVVPTVQAAGKDAGKPAAAARVYLALEISARDPKTQAASALRPPAAFPRSAPGNGPAQARLRP